MTQVILPSNEKLKSLNSEVSLAVITAEDIEGWFDKNKLSMEKYQTEPMLRLVVFDIIKFFALILLIGMAGLAFPPVALVGMFVWMVCAIRKQPKMTLLGMGILVCGGALAGSKIISSDMLMFAFFMLVIGYCFWNVKTRVNKAMEFDAQLERASIGAKEIHNILEKEMLPYVYQEDVFAVDGLQRIFGLEDLHPAYIERVLDKEVEAERLELVELRLPDGGEQILYQAT